jgi:glycosyltransferase involved in cell wall biosynthesis
MKLSVIIATYNAVENLPKTLDSILAQTNKDYEVLVIDGKSTDGTQKLASSYEKQFEGRLTIVSEPDEGIYDAMNKGIDAAKGEWLYFLGAGDYFIDNRVLEYIAANTDGADVVYGSIQWGEKDIISHGKFTRTRLVGLNMNHQTIFCRKSVFAKTGKFDTKYKLSADYIFNMAWFNDRSIRKRYLGRVIAVYDNTGQSSVSIDKKFLQDAKALKRKYFPWYILVSYTIWLVAHRLRLATTFILKGDLAGLRVTINDRLEKK